MGLSGDIALALAKSYTRQTAEGMGAVKGQDGFSPIIIESQDNTDEVYKLNIQTATGSITTPNLKGENGQDGTDGINGTNGITPHIDTATKHWFIGTVDTDVVAIGKDGAQGIHGEQGKQGVQGIQGIQGIPGEKGGDGYPFLIYKEYDNLSEFQSSDFPQIGLLFMVNSGENERPVYRVTGESEQPYSFVTNLSGAEGIKGEKGEQGIQGIQGVPGEPGKDGTTYTPSIGTVTTLEPNANASASVSVDEETKTAQFDFAIPRGEKGEEGISPSITVNTDTESEYTLDITDKNGTFTTPNLRKEGTKDYEHLINLPKVNGITLTGNKTLEDLGIAKAITDAIGNVTQISFEVVESFAALPTIGEVGTFYLVPNIARANNNYNEYIWDVNNLQYELIGSIQSDIDLSNYYTKAQVDELVNKMPTGQSDCAPVGTIISFMGLNAPSGYLKCDGTTYNISQYQELANHFKKEYAMVNYFGGNGTTTFAVPDLRGEFLRGVGTATRNTGSGGLCAGEHQDGTGVNNLLLGGNGNNNLIQTFQDGNYRGPTNVDKTIVYSNKWCNYSSVGSGNQTTANSIQFTTRPTNTSVLYCIKYKKIV